MSVELERLFTYAEAAAELGVTTADCADPVRWIYEKVRAYDLEFVRVGRTPKLPLRSIQALSAMLLKPATEEVAEFDSLMRDRPRTTPAHIDRAPDTAIYFFQMERSGHIKIGIARNVDRRLEAVQCGNPEKIKVLASTQGWLAHEKELHRIFAGDRLNGEWFRYNDLLGRVIARINGGAHVWDVIQALRELRPQPVRVRA